MSTSQCWAVIIGINHYDRHPEYQLNYAVNDAEQMRDFLSQKAGFPLEQICICLGDRDRSGEPNYPTSSRLFELLDKDLHPDRVGQADWFWFFFSGHGLSRDGIDYLVPCDHNVNDEQLRWTLPVTEVIAFLRRHRHANIVLVLDKCRQLIGRKHFEPRNQDNSALGAKTLKLAQEKRITIISSCDYGEFSYEIPSQHQGVFTCALIQGLQQYTLPIELETFVRQKVRKILRQNGIGYRQTPKISLDSASNALLPLLPESCMTDADLEVLQHQAVDAELIAKSSEEFEEIETLWWRVIQSSRSGRLFTKAQESIRRIHEKMLRLRLEREFSQLLDKARSREREAIRRWQTLEQEKQTWTIYRTQQQQRLSQLQREKGSLEAQLQARARDHQAQLEAQKRQYEEQLQQLQSVAQQTLKRLQEDNATQSQIRREQAQFRRQLELMRSEYQSQLEEQERGNQAEVVELQRQIADLESRLKIATTQGSISAELGQIPQELPEQPEVELKSDKGINYRLLQDLLRSGKWKAADHETATRMLEVMGKSDWWEVNRQDLLSFPCVDLRTLDRLWVYYSQGKFGFSVQKQIYVESGAKLDRNYPGDKVWEEFCQRIGWRVNNDYLAYSELKFSTNAPSGHLPRVLGFGGWGLGMGLGVVGGVVLWGVLFSRIQICRV